MNIDDILKKERFRDLDLFLNKEMYKTAGKKLVGKMIEIFGTEIIARDWFYSPSTVFENKRAYDFCKDGKIPEVEKVLGRIEYGNFNAM